MAILTLEFMFNRKKLQHNRTKGLLDIARVHEKQEQEELYDV